MILSTDSLKRSHRLTRADSITSDFTYLRALFYYYYFITAGAAARRSLAGLAREFIRACFRDCAAEISVIGSSPAALRHGARYGGDVTGPNRKDKGRDGSENLYRSIYRPEI